jgi:cystathionine gamma-synthase
MDVTASEPDPTCGSPPAVRDLSRRPLWRPDDLGAPIPASPHAVSVCLPTWADNIGYEEQDPRVHATLSTGYPRFVYNRFCRELFAACEARFARDGETCLVWPSIAAAERFARWLGDRTGDATRVHALGLHDAHAVCFSRRHAALARTAWQHGGEGITSRPPEACLGATPPVGGPPPAPRHGSSWRAGHRRAVTRSRRRRG